MFVVAARVNVESVGGLILDVCENAPAIVGLFFVEQRGAGDSVVAQAATAHDT